MSKIHNWKFTIIWSSVILFLSFYKFPQTHGEGLIPDVDKIVHFGMYFILAAILKIEAKIDDMKIFLFTILFGGIIEIFQSLLTNYRSGDPNDLLFDFLGAIFFCSLYEIRQTYFKAK